MKYTIRKERFYSPLKQIFLLRARFLYQSFPINSIVRSISPVSRKIITKQNGTVSPIKPIDTFTKGFCLFVCASLSDNQILCEYTEMILTRKLDSKQEEAHFACKGIGFANDKTYLALSEK